LKEVMHLPLRFDPFNDRPARDIRNQLSEAFIEGLRCDDLASVHRLADRWMASHPAEQYTGYIQDRLRRYEDVLAALAHSPTAGWQGQLVALWNRHLFFEVHELLETIWRAATGNRRRALQGLIRAAAAFVHLEQGNREAAGRLAEKARQLIGENTDELRFIGNLPQLAQALKQAGDSLSWIELALRPEPATRSERKNPRNK
jgi:predicted metal-dependent hydrolase